MRGLRYLAIATALLVTLASASCSTATRPVASQPAAQPTVAAPTPAAAATPVVQYVGNLSLSPNHGAAGTTVTATGAGLPPSSPFDLVWNTVQGSWKLEGTYQESFKGRDFKPVANSIASVTTDPTGAFRTTFTAPEGFGFQHDVTLVQNGVVRNQASFNVDMQVTISPSSGPVGTPITVEAKGVGWQYLYNVWQVGYDNKMTGWFSSVTTGGIAHATIPATGAPGKHLVQLFSGTPTYPYLNTPQSPTPDRPTFTLEFTVTDGPPVLPPPAESQGLATVAGTAPVDGQGPSLWTNPLLGRVGTPVTLRGQGFPAGQALEVLWFRVVGNRMSGKGWDETSTSLGTTTVKADGTLELPFKTPDDLGGPHRIEVQANGQKLAETRMTITPSALALEPASGPAGTDFTLHLKGGGWTETANIYLLTYDNTYLGYACAFNSQGDLTIHLPAAGEPGWHYIDLYPGIYKGDDVKGVENLRVPQLTYEDHPGEKLPVFHFAFQVTK